MIHGAIPMFLLQIWGWQFGPQKDLLGVFGDTICIVYIYIHIYLEPFDDPAVLIGKLALFFFGR